MFEHFLLFQVGLLVHVWLFMLVISDDEFGEKTVSVLLDGEESEMVFIDHPSVEMSVSKRIFLFELIIFPKIFV